MADLVRNHNVFLWRGSCKYHASNETKGRVYFVFEIIFYMNLCDPVHDAVSNL